MNTAEVNHGNSPSHQDRQREEGRKKEMRTALMVVASLIATSTYQAAVNPPGKLKESDYPRYKGFRFFNIFTFVNSVGIMTQLLLDAVVTGDIKILGVTFMKVIMIINLFCFAVAFALAFSDNVYATVGVLVYPTLYILICVVIELSFKRKQKRKEAHGRQIHGQPAPGPGVNPVPISTTAGAGSASFHITQPATWMC